MPERPYTLLSCGMSIDGYIDTATDERLALSNNADLDRVDAVRADSDAILVGAATLRNDNPRLLVRRAHRPRPAANPDQGDRHQSRSAGPVRRLLRHR
jgi:5-amino-6-(5-phosphoribosylamino)uracil reductase